VKGGSQSELRSDRRTHLSALCDFFPLGFFFVNEADSEAVLNASQSKQVRENVSVY